MMIETALQYAMDELSDLKSESPQRTALIEFYQLVCESLKKQIPDIPYIFDKAVYGPEDFRCPFCNRSVQLSDHHCECGQLLTWSQPEFRKYI